MSEDIAARAFRSLTRPGVWVDNIFYPDELSGGLEARWLSPPEQDLSVFGEPSAEASNDLEVGGGAP